MAAYMYNHNLCTNAGTYTYNYAVYPPVPASPIPKSLILSQTNELLWCKYWMAVPPLAAIVHLVEGKFEYAVFVRVFD